MATAIQIPTGELVVMRTKRHSTKIQNTGNFEYLIKNYGNSSGVYIGTIYFSEHLEGRRVRFRVELVDDEKEQPPV